jgi:hypothetical protein
MVGPRRLRIVTAARAQTSLPRASYETSMQPSPPTKSSRRSEAGSQAGGLWREPRTAVPALRIVEALGTTFSAGCPPSETFRCDEKALASTLERVGPCWPVKCAPGGDQDAPRALAADVVILR